MFTLTLILAICCADPAKIEPPHDQNSVFVHVLDQGVEVGGQKVTLPAPRLVDGAGATPKRTALKEIAGSDRAVDDLFRDSVTAPFIIKVHDVKAAGATVRQADLYFVVYGDLKGVDPEHEATRTDPKTVEVANMWFETRTLKAEDIRTAGVKASETKAVKSWYVHTHAKLLDRIEFETTNHVVGSVSADSTVIASATDPAFTGAGELSNGWKPLSKAREPRRATPSSGSRMKAELATPRSAASPSSQVRSSSKCTSRSWSQTDGSTVRRYCGQSSAWRPKIKSARSEENWPSSGRNEPE